MDDTHIGTGNYKAHFKAANEKLFRATEKDPALARSLGLKQSEVSALQHSDVPPTGYKWHHHQDVGRMQLVQEAEHRAALSHTGGMAIWGGGYSK